MLPTLHRFHRARQLPFVQGYNVLTRSERAKKPRRHDGGAACSPSATGAFGARAAMNTPVSTMA